MSYLGQQLGQGQAERFIYTATGGETSVTSDDLGRAIAYTVGQVDVYLNGAKLINGSDFTATTGTSITGLAALTASDVVEVFALSIFQASDTVSAASGGTFNGNVTVDANLSVTGTTTITTADINGGTIDGASLGASSAITALTVNGNVSIDGGTIKLDGNYPVGTDNVALGNTALDSLVSGNYSTAIGANALTANTASSNTGIGFAALEANTSGTQNTAVGMQALTDSTTANNNTAIGHRTLYVSTTGANNVAVGVEALQANTTASNNTAVGYQAGYSNTVGQENVFIGYKAGYTSNSSGPYGSTPANVAVGPYAGYSLTTGYGNTFIGGYTAGTAAACGYLITTGSKNTIIGGYNGNQGGLDIRTSSNNIVLSDGDGDVRAAYDSSKNNWGIVGGQAGVGRIEARLQITVADDATLILTDSECGACIVHVYDNDIGQGAVYFANFVGGTSVIAGETLGNFATSDTDNRYCLYKSSGAHQLTFKNRIGASRSFAFMIIGAQAALS